MAARTRTRVKPPHGLNVEALTVDNERLLVFEWFWDACENSAPTVTRRDREPGREPALVSGRWSIVDFVDRDGKRLLLARKNPVDDERDVLWLATHGHSRKYIADELGLGVSQVGRRLSSAMRKLRVPSRRELLQRFGGS